ncbi:MAG: paraquat-inducible protein A [Phycisphaerales bacterium]|nr:MAG: paraquat-inducible protein A [Phycisphaerales bacterium]
MHDVSTDEAPASVIHACPCCGLPQRVPVPPPRTRACCARCGTALHRRLASFRSNSRTAAIALAALILYPLAVTLPMLRIEKFGRLNDVSILGGAGTLLGSGHIIVGAVVLLCSVVLPLGKLLTMLVLSAGGLVLRSEHRALSYRVVEWTGRWGMLDVLLVSIVVAAVKVGDWVDVKAGPAALAFAACVVLSMLATTTFDPRSLWESQVTGIRAPDRLDRRVPQE